MSTSVVKWSEGLSNRVSVIIRRYIYCMRFAAILLFCLSHFIIFFQVYFVSLCIWLYVLYASVYFCTIISYVFVLLHMFRRRYSVSLCCSVYCFV